MDKQPDENKETEVQIEQPTMPDTEIGNVIVHVTGICSKASVQSA